MRIVILSILLASAAPVAAERPPPPEAMVGQAVSRITATVAACRLPLAGDPVALRGLIDQQLRPKLDVLYAGQLILGRHWAEAEPAQRRRFAEALYGTLVNRYATGLLLLTDGMVTVLPRSGAPAEGQAEVALRINTRMSAPIPVFLQMRHGNDLWRGYDARWEGQSYVLSLRQVFTQEIRQQGLETVIQRLEASAGMPVGAPEDRDTAAGRCLRARAAR